MILHSIQNIGNGTILCFISMLIPALSASCGEWTSLADTNVSRQYPGLVHLPGNRILAVTGHPLGGKSIDSAEIYDISKNIWVPTDSLAVPRNGVQPGGLIMLPNGKVLIAGSGSGSRSVHEAELFDPESETWSTTGSMSVPRCVHTSTQLDDGRVLVVGGIDWTTNEVHPTAEIYDFVTGMWVTAGTMQNPRWNHRAIKLSDGKVLVIGGASTASSEEGILASTELFDPKTGTWSATSPMRRARRSLGATLLDDGRVIVVGGKKSPREKFRQLSDVEIYDPNTKNWSDAAPLVEGRWGPSVTRLDNGEVLVVGGMYGRVGRRKSAEIFDPVRGTWRDAGQLSKARNGHRAILLKDGSVLIVGGYSGAQYLTSCEVYKP